MNWFLQKFNKFAGANQKIQKYDIKNIPLKSFIHKYENLIDWNIVNNEKDIQLYIKNNLLSQLYSLIDPKSENNYYIKDINIYEELNNIQQNDPQYQHINAIIKSNPDEAKQKLLNHLNQEKSNVFFQWWNYLTQENDIYKNNPAFIFIILKPIFDSSNSLLKSAPISLDQEALSFVYDKLSDNIQSNIYKSYKTELYNKETFYNNKSNVKDGWIHIKSKQNDPNNFEKNLETLKRLSHGTGWCTAGNQIATSYLSNGDFYIFIDDHSSAVAIRTEGNSIAEIRGLQNTKPLQYWKNITQLLESSNIDYENNELFLEFQEIQQINMKIDELLQTNQFEKVEQFINSITLYRYNRYGESEPINKYYNIKNIDINLINKYSKLKNYILRLIDQDIKFVGLILQQSFRNEEAYSGYDIIHEIITLPKSLQNIIDDNKWTQLTKYLIDIMNKYPRFNDLMSIDITNDILQNKYIKRNIVQNENLLLGFNKAIQTKIEEAGNNDRIFFISFLNQIQFIDKDILRIDKNIIKNKLIQFSEDMTPSEYNSNKEYKKLLDLYLSDEDINNLVKKHIQTYLNGQKKSYYGDSPIAYFGQDIYKKLDDATKIILLSKWFDNPNKHHYLIYKGISYVDSISNNEYDIVPDNIVEKVIKYQLQHNASSLYINFNNIKDKYKKFIPLPELKNNIKNEMINSIDFVRSNIYLMDSIDKLFSETELLSIIQQYIETIDPNITGLFYCEKFINILHNNKLKPYISKIPIIKMNKMIETLIQKDEYPNSNNMVQLYKNLPTHIKSNLNDNLISIFKKAINIDIQNNPLSYDETYKNDKIINNMDQNTFDKLYNYHVEKYNNFPWKIMFDNNPISAQVIKDHYKTILPKFVEYLFTLGDSDYNIFKVYNIIPQNITTLMHKLYNYKIADELNNIIQKYPDKFNKLPYELKYLINRNTMVSVINYYQNYIKKNNITKQHALKFNYIPYDIIVYLKFETDPIRENKISSKNFYKKLITTNS